MFLSVLDYNPSTKVFNLIDLDIKDIMAKNIMTKK